MFHYGCLLSCEENFVFLRHVTYLQKIYVSNGYVNNKRNVNVQRLRTPDIYYFTILPWRIHTHTHARLTCEHRARMAKFRNLFQPLRRALIWICRDIPIPMPPVTNRMNNQMDLEQWRRRIRRSETQFSVSWSDRAQKRNIGDLRADV